MKRETGYYLVIEDGELSILWYYSRSKKFYYPTDSSSCMEDNLHWVSPTPLNLELLKESYND